MAYLKHSSNGSKGKQRSAKKPEAEQALKVLVTGPDVSGYTPTPSMQHDINHVAGLADIEASLDWIAKGISKLTSDEHCVQLSTGYATHPLKITLALSDYDDAMDRVILAVERIADALAKLAGLSRPRLERWYEQDEYEPLGKDTACDGGAPGPKINPGPEEGKIS